MECFCNKLQLILWTILISTILLVRGDGEIQPSKNMFNDISMDTFDHVTRDKDIMLILFYMPW